MFKYQAKKSLDNFFSSYGTKLALVGVNNSGKRVVGGRLEKQNGGNMKPIKLITAVITLASLFVLILAMEAYASLAENSGDGAQLKEVQTQIKINIPERRLRLFHAGELVYDFPVAVGQPIYQTPTGSRTLTEIVWNPWWIPPASKWAEGEEKVPPGPGNPLGAVKMRLGETILIHGTNKEATVGSAASHGCMRMRRQDVIALAWWIQQHYSDQTDPALLETYKKNGSTSYHVQLTSPIPVSLSYQTFELADGLLKSHPDVYGKLGDRKGEAVAMLESSGIKTHTIDEKALQALLQSSKKQSVGMPVKEILGKDLRVKNGKMPYTMISLKAKLANING